MRPLRVDSASRAVCPAVDGTHRRVYDISHRPRGKVAHERPRMSVHAGGSLWQRVCHVEEPFIPTSSHAAWNESSATLRQGWSSVLFLPWFPRVTRIRGSASQPLYAMKVIDTSAGEKRP